MKFFMESLIKSVIKSLIKSLMKSLIKSLMKSLMKLYYTARYSTCRKIRHSVHSKTAKNEAFFKKNILKCFLLVLGTMERYEVELRLKWNLACFFFSWNENNIPKKTERRSLHPKRVQKTEKTCILFFLHWKLNDSFSAPWQNFFSSLRLFWSSGRLVSSNIFKHALSSQANPYTDHAAWKIVQSAASRN